MRLDLPSRRRRRRPPRLRPKEVREPRDPWTWPRDAPLGAARRRTTVCWASRVPSFVRFDRPSKSSFLQRLLPPPRLGRRIRPLSFPPTARRGCGHRVCRRASRRLLRRTTMVPIGRGLRSSIFPTCRFDGTSASCVISNFSAMTSAATRRLRPCFVIRVAFATLCVEPCVKSHCLKTSCGSP